MYEEALRKALDRSLRKKQRLAEGGKHKRCKKPRDKGPDDDSTDIDSDEESDVNCPPRFTIREIALFKKRGLWKQPSDAGPGPDPGPSGIGPGPDPGPSGAGLGPDPGPSGIGPGPDPGPSGIGPGPSGIGPGPSGDLDDPPPMPPPDTPPPMPHPDAAPPAPAPSLVSRSVTFRHPRRARGENSFTDPDTGREFCQIRDGPDKRGLHCRWRVFTTQVAPGHAALGVLIF